MYDCLTSRPQDELAPVVEGDGIPVAVALCIYRWMCTSRRIDEMERELLARGEAFFHVGAAGHEASASLAPFLARSDYIHAHYRDKALMLARGMPVREFFDSLLCNAASHSAGRQMSAHLSSPSLNILSVVGPVGNNALQAAGIAQQIKNDPERPIVVCSLGDGSTQQGEVLEAIAEAVRSTLPVLFLVHDNRYSISTRTAGQTFFSTPQGDAASFYGLPLHRLDGCQLHQCYAGFRRLVDQVRRSRGPAICIMAVERLTDHTNADDETVYRDAAEIRQVHARADPIANALQWLLARDVPKADLDSIDAAIDAVVRAAALGSLECAAPAATLHAAEPSSAGGYGSTLEYRGDGQRKLLTMAEALRETLRARMYTDLRVTLYGQDIEDPKGDVFGVTRGLSTAFPGRVRNAPLSESTIVGTSIGRALAGGRPVAFLQFADFLPLAFNQLATELASMHWRTQGGWCAPVILLVSCGAYRPGLGPFHAHTFDSALAHVPGLDVVVPSTAADSAGMLNAAFASERPTVMLYPKALLHARCDMTSDDVHAQWVPLATARLVQPGADLTLVGWGNSVVLCQKAAHALAKAGVAAEVIDLRCLAPWDRTTVQRSVARTRKLLVVHEDNLSAGFGAEVIASMAEAAAGGITFRRVARSDVFVPCHFGNQLEVLPSYRRTLEVAADMLGLDLLWERGDPVTTNRQVVHAIGSSPADQTLDVVEIPVRAGDAVVAGQTVASVEADKAIVDIASPADGVVEEIHLAIGDCIPVGTPLMTLAVRRARQSQPMGEREDIAHLSVRQIAGRSAAIESTPTHTHTVALQGLGSVCGNVRMDNRILAPLLPTLASPDHDGIFERTGIESRNVAGKDQNAIGMALDAAHLAMRDAGITPKELSLVICSTSTPTMIAPSTACQVLHRLGSGIDVPAYDIQAACSGYLYALAQAWDFLQQQPQAHVLVLTTELLSGAIDTRDPQTAPIFGDAATATVLSGGAHNSRILATLQRPVLSARGDDGTALQVPLPGTDARVHMDGKRIFTEAIRSMGMMLTKACAEAGVKLGDIDLVVPHQANGRIIEAMRTRLKLTEGRVWNEIRYKGNTSSSSIPLALDTVLRQPDGAKRLAICAFGAGFTAGAALISRPAG